MNGSRLEWAFIFALAALLIGIIYRIPSDTVLLGFVTFFLIVMGHFSLNNFFDIDTDRLNTRKISMRNPFIEKNMVQAKHVYMWVGMLLGLSWLLIILSFYQSFIKELVLTVVLMLSFSVSVVYSVPPLRLKGRPFLDLVSTSGIFGCVLPTWIGLLGAEIRLEGLSLIILFPIPLHVLLLIIVLAVLLINGIHLPTILIDLEYDKAAGDITTAVWLGQERTATVSALVVLLSITGMGIIMNLFKLWGILDFSILGYLLGVIEMYFAFKLWRNKDRESAMTLCKAIVVINSIGVLDYFRVNLLSFRLLGM
jgi:4-hydroxybenzoate polyprenyltransferase